MSTQPAEPMETFRLLSMEWSIDKAVSLIGDRDPAGVVNVADFRSLIGPDRRDQPADGPRAFGLIHVDWDVVDLMPEVILDQPVIVAPTDVAGESLFLIDGWHRVALANRVGRETLPGHLLSVDESRQCLTRRSSALMKAAAR